MKATYLDQIENKITAHRQTIQALQHEIDKLQGAAEVIAQLRGNDGFETTKALDITPDRRTSQSYTIRKITGGGTMDIKGPELQKRIKAALEAHRDGLNLTGLAEALAIPNNKQAKNRVWYQLNEMRKAGKIDVDGHTYFLKREAPQYEDG